MSYPSPMPETATAALPEPVNSPELPQIAQIPRRGNAPWTADEARAMARRGNAKRWSPEARAARAGLPIPQLTPANRRPDDRWELVTEQINLTRATLNRKSLEPKDRAQLLRALCGLLDRERILRGEPLPGSLKPSSGRPKEAAPPGAWLADEQPAAPRILPPAAPAP